MSPVVPRILISAALALLVACSPADPPDAAAADLAKAALAALDADGLSRASLDTAAADVARARELNVDDPWVALATSELALATGYRRGDAFRGRSYHPKALVLAEREAQRALQLGPDIARVHRTLAKVQIIQGKLREGWTTLNSAYSLEPEHFRPWLLRAVIARRMKDPERALSLLDEADKRALEVADRRLVLSQRSKLVRSTGTPEQELALLQKITELDPQHAHSHGNLGAALLRHRRYEEAIVRLELALSIARYPLAEQQLAMARQRLAEKTSGTADKRR